ncbi:Adrenodoxin-like, mitochondrial [Hondaea fermentalgiana]|uniref:Adrenodoxin-like, mitochondrial n=1 Tax=Hondaea fermentalgiana TaxID=2315210 RepID=A0A2R5GU31_9STRA|nr:Adrenodoxin-like, mitochondrial [Hondaea fermentalgiana]|eukprot:GBG34372.1 Adrenodoxin-like, mitochondrial [Hondaea fermentalgiana]
MLGSVLRSAGRQGSRLALRQTSLAASNSLAKTQAPVMFRGASMSAVRDMSTVKIVFMDAEGATETVDAEIGDSILDIAHEHDIEMEGACGGEMACSTCHCILDEATYHSLPAPEEEEEDMLDLALGLTETSRLGCQVIVTKDMEGIVIRLPAETANMQ